jgi:hypothetical protein
VAGGASAWSFTPEGVTRRLRGGDSPYRFGKGLDTRGANGVFFVETLSRAAQDGTILVMNLPGAGRTPIATRRGSVAGELVWPLLRGQDVGPWVASPSARMLVPHDPAELARPLSANELRSRTGQTLDFLRAFRAHLRARTRYQGFEPTDDCYWMLSGPLEHMLSPHIVVVREIQNRPAAAVVSARFAEDLLRTTQPLIEHKLLFCAVSSNDEAHYLVGAINAEPMQELLASFVNPVAVSPQTLARLPIPAFDPDLHRAVVEAARAVASAVNAGGVVSRAAAERRLAEAVVAVAGAAAHS